MNNIKDSLVFVNWVFGSDPNSNEYIICCISDWGNTDISVKGFDSVELAIKFIAEMARKYDGWNFTSKNDDGFMAWKQTGKN